MEEAVAAGVAEAAPVRADERISSMDVLRGAALLGIALMNIVFSGLPMAANWNPKVSGGAEGWNLAAFVIQYVFCDGKMRGTFSIMFGAGSYYLVTRAVSKGAGILAAEIYYRRTLWLLLFGILHAYLIWHGDILYPYALLGLVLLPLHRLSAKTLLIAAGIAVLGMTAMMVKQGFGLQKTYQLAMEAEKAKAAKQPLTEEQKEAQTSWEQQRKYVHPTAEDLKKEREMYSGSYLNLLGKRAGMVGEWHSQPFYTMGWDMLTMMLIGIAFAKMGVLAGTRSFAFYTRMLVAGYAVGLPVGGIAVWMAYQQGFEPMQTVFVFSTYQVARVATTLGHIAALLLICKAGWLPGLRARLAAIGQTAFSNYILHSLIYGVVFYGYGFNLFDKLERYQLYLVVLGMWILSLVVSPIWLANYRFGPLEWCWRSLTYWKRQPMRIAEAPAGGVVMEAA